MQTRSWTPSADAFVTAAGREQSLGSGRQWTEPGSGMQWGEDRETGWEGQIVTVLASQRHRDTEKEENEKREQERKTLKL